MNKGFASKTGSVALALSLLSGNAWAAANCARPLDMAGLQTAAMQQNLMVAAFACQDVDAYNSFVIAYQGELQESDHALMKFFLQSNAQTGSDDYDAYKTGLANASSLRSLHDPQFCSDASVSFGVALGRKIALEELVSERPSPIQTGYASCVPGAPDTVLVADATPSLPVRHQALLDSPPSPKPSIGSAQAGEVRPPPGYDRGNDGGGDNKGHASNNVPGADAHEAH